MARFNVVFAGGGNDASEQPVCADQLEALETYGWQADVEARDEAEAIVVFNAVEAGMGGCKPEPGDHYLVGKLPDIPETDYVRYVVDQHEAIAPAL